MYRNGYGWKIKVNGRIPTATIGEVKATRASVFVLLCVMGAICGIIYKKTNSMVENFTRI